MNHQDDKETELRLREQELREREIAIRLRELEAEVHSKSHAWKDLGFASFSVIKYSQLSGDG